jgi:myo-inositol-1(or 4)-monophosphatase
MADPEVRDLVDILTLHPLLPLAWKSASIAGRFLLEERPDHLVVDTKSSASDTVTAMDRTAEALIVGEVQRERPDDAVLGEEGGARGGTSGVRWIIDPLDGTVNYLARLPMWGVSVAVEESGTVTVGVIATPEFGDAYVGVLGHGAWRIVGPRAEQLSVRDCTRLTSAIVSTGFGYDPGTRLAQARVVSDLIPRIADIRRMGSAVVDLCWLARGRLDAHFESGLNHWDYAAGALIAAEAGAVATGLRDDDLSAFVLVAVPGIVDDLRAQLIQLGADNL